MVLALFKFLALLFLTMTALAAWWRGLTGWLMYLAATAGVFGGLYWGGDPPPFWPMAAIFTMAMVLGLGARGWSYYRVGNKAAHFFPPILGLPVALLIFGLLIGPIAGGGIGWLTLRRHLKGMGAKEVGIAQTWGLAWILQGVVVLISLILLAAILF